MECAYALTYTHASLLNLLLVKMLSYRVLLVMFLLNYARSQNSCSLPSDSELLSEFRNALISQGGDGGSNAEITYFSYVCRAVGELRGTYRSLSVIIEYIDNRNRQRVAQMQLVCTRSGSTLGWLVESDSLEIVATGEYDRSYPEREDCSRCTRMASTIQKCEGMYHTYLLHKV